MSLDYKRIGIICSGTLLEVYDSYVFAFLMPEINRIFLPFDNHQQILSVIMFSIIFIVRPISGILWGLLGDSSGKSYVFRNSMLFMAIVTFFIGVLPTYAQIGFAAPLLLFTLRIAQGISISGELSSAIVLSYEQSSDESRYKNHGLLYACIFFGIVLANLMVLMLNQHGSLSSSYMWRIPFIFGGILGFLVYLARRKIKFPEPLYKVNLPNLFTHHIKPILYSIIANCFVNLSWFYFSSTNTVLKENQINSSYTPLICSIIAVLSCYLSGYLFSTYKKRQILFITVSSIAVHFILLILLLTNQAPQQSILIFYYAEAAISGCIFTIIPVFIISTLPKAYRNSIYTISVNTSTALIVGILPLILHSIHNNQYFNFYLLLMGTIVIIFSVIGTLKLQTNKLR